MKITNSTPAMITATQGWLPASRPNMRLDKNELTRDGHAEWKQQALDEMMQAEWNRYPESDTTGLEALVAQYAGVEPGQVALGAGSAALIHNLLNYFALQGKHLVIVQPTYAYFEHHCRAFNIPFTPWYLNEYLEFDFDHLPAMDANTVLVITSPNNPVGNTLDIARLENLLHQFPQTQVLLDNVYYEYSETDFTPLLERFSNLMILRSFSKAFPVAGVRFGYLCAHPEVASRVRRLSPTYSLNHFTRAVASHLLSKPGLCEAGLAQVSSVIRRRELLSAALLAYFSTTEIEVFPSGGNFLLIRTGKGQHSRVLSAFKQHGIQILDASGFPMLQDCMRISIGSAQECKAVLEILLLAFDKSAALAELHYEQESSFTL